MGAVLCPSGYREDAMRKTTNAFPQDGLRCKQLTLDGGSSSETSSSRESQSTVLQTPSKHRKSGFSAGWLTRGFRNVRMACCVLCIKHNCLPHNGLGHGTRDPVLHIGKRASKDTKHLICTSARSCAREMP